MKTRKGLILKKKKGEKVKSKKKEPDKKKNKRETKKNNNDKREGRALWNSKNVDSVWIKNKPAEKKERTGEKDWRRSFRMAAAPYEITANAQNSDALDQLGWRQSLRKSAIWNSELRRKVKETAWGGEGSGGGLTLSR